ncbi:MAG: nickel pincer cofactor biosynthesis protein LarB [Spirochaetes bacterium]|nr:nickel pincer cofactor biosynthesis protein LarB [Spirochaetota bacterium]
MDQDKLLALFEQIKKGEVSPTEALDQFKNLPFKDLDFVKIDSHRLFRKQLGEVIYSQNKKMKQLITIYNHMKELNQPKIIFTRITPKKAHQLMEMDNQLIYNEKARILYKAEIKVQQPGQIAVVTAGTTDIPVAEEAACIAEIMGNKVKRFFDCGVAGIHRLFGIYDDLVSSNVIVCAAGMEGALPSVVSGLVDVPIIALPTAIGYGANFKGVSALLTMINSCSPGIAVVNIDNGFGAGYMAGIINMRRK